MTPGADGAAVPRTSSGTGYPQSCALDTNSQSPGRVLTDAVLESQYAIVDAVRGVASALTNMHAVLSAINHKSNELVEKVNDASGCMIVHFAN